VTPGGSVTEVVSVVTAVTVLVLPLVVNMDVTSWHFVKAGHFVHSVLTELGNVNKLLLLGEPHSPGRHHHKEDNTSPQCQTKG